MKEKKDTESLEKLLEDREDIYFGAQAEKTFQEEQEFVTHEEVKRKLLKK